VDPGADGDDGVTPCHCGSLADGLRPIAPAWGSGVADGIVLATAAPAFEPARCPEVRERQRFRPGREPPDRHRRPLRVLYGVFLI